MATPDLINRRPHHHTREIVTASSPKPPDATAPTAPDLGPKELWCQFWADVYGKEVQTAATYSYTWLADQVGHICLGILINFLATLVSGWIMVKTGHAQSLAYDTGLWPGLIATVVIVSLWEFSAYWSSARQATGAFPLGTKLLRDNAVVAAAYMALGALLGFAFHLDAIPALTISAAVAIVAIWLAPRWLRQKIIWQKASIPYLFRLADAAPTISSNDARTLLELINSGAPCPAVPACQVVVGGPIGSGRTSMAAGIATEFAFTNNKVRYLSFDSLTEFAATATSFPYPDDLGPTTISYWRWSEAQVVVIDDVGPMIAAQEPQRKANLVRFTALLNGELQSIAPALKQSHTIWVIGDLCPPFASGTLSATLDDFAKAIAKYCDSKSDPLVIELGSPPAKLAPKGTLLGTTRRSSQPANVRNIRRVHRS
jgi:hypothetical protein